MRRIEPSLNLNVRGMTPSATVAINERSNAMLAAGRTVYKLGLGQSPFPVPNVVVQTLRDAAHEKDYLPVVGLPALRAAVAAYHGRQGVTFAPEDVLIGPGSKELMFILQLVFYGELVIPTPSWVSYAPQAKIIGRSVRWVDTWRDNRHKLTADALRSCFAEDPDRPRLVILNYPNNPTGYSYDADELAAIAEVAREYGALLLSDEIYGELHHEGEHVSIATMYPEGTIISAGLSKWCGAGGWRLGTFSFPPQLAWLRDAMATVASETFTSTSAPIQYAAVTAFDGDASIEKYLVDSRRVLRGLGRWCAARLRAAGASVDDPDGGFYLMPDFSPLDARLRARGIDTSRALAERALEATGTAFLPGEDFGRDPRELTARLAYVDFDGAAALEAVAAVDGEPDDAFYARTCPRVVAGIEALAGWVDG